MARRRRSSPTTVAVAVAVVLVAIVLIRRGMVPSVVWTLLVAVAVVYIVYRLIGVRGRR